MITNPPLIPDGPGSEATFCRWARDQIVSLARIQDVPGAKVLRTTRGTAVIPEAAAVLKSKPRLVESSLTHALWAPAPKKIYGCRGGSLLEFDSGGNYTGNSLAFADPYLGESYLALDPSGNLWASYWHDFNAGERQSSIGFYQIDISKMAIVKFVPFPAPQGVNFSSDTLASIENFLVSSLPWPPSSGPGVGPNFSTPFNTGAAIGDAFFNCGDGSNISAAAGYPWLGTFSPAPVAYDFYLQALVSSGNPQIWYAVDHQAIQGVDPVINLGTQPTGRTNSIVHVPAGSRLSLNIPLGEGAQSGSAPLECIFGLTGSLTSFADIVYGSGILGVGPRRFGFSQSDQSILLTFLDNGFAQFYNIDQTGVIISNTGPGSNRVGSPGWNAFYLDPSNNDVWMGNDVGLSQVTGGHVAGYFEAFAAINDPINNHFVRWSGAVYGVDYSPSNQSFYMVTCSPQVMLCPRFAASIAAGHSGLNPDVTSFLLPRAAAKPRNIRFVPFSVNDPNQSRLYIPTMSDNTVLELDPSTNQVTNTFTGFDCPFDIVATDKLIFAIQLGKTGLQRVK